MNILKYALILQLILITQPAYAKGWNQSEDQDCAIEKTPLTRCGEFDSYMNADKILNANYKILLKKLDKTKLVTLKTKQREWIKWRDEKCEEAQEAAGCNSGACAGVEHDMCIVTLTNQRAEELKKFESAKNETDFNFSKEYDNK